VVFVQTNLVVVWVQIVNLGKNVEKHGALGFNYFASGITTLSGHIGSSKFGEISSNFNTFYLMNTIEVK